MKLAGHPADMTAAEYFYYCVSEVLANPEMFGDRDWVHVAPSGVSHVIRPDGSAVLCGQRQLPATDGSSYALAAGSVPVGRPCARCLRIRLENVDGADTFDREVLVTAAKVAISYDRHSLNAIFGGEW